MAKRWPVKTRIETRDVRITNDHPKRKPSYTDIYDLETGAKSLDVYRAVVSLDGEGHEVTRQTALPRDYEGPALLERSDRAEHAKFVGYGDDVRELP